MRSSRLATHRFDAHSDSDSESENQKVEFVTHFDQAEKKQSKKTELVIPLIRQNNWRCPPQPDKVDVTDAASTPPSAPIPANGKRWTGDSVTTPFEDSASPEEADDEDIPMNQRFGLILSKKRRRLDTTPSTTSNASNSSSALPPPQTTSIVDMLKAENPDDDEDQIAARYLREAAAALDGTSALSGGFGKSELEIPLMALNKIPGIDDIQDEKDKFLLDMSLRPEESTMEDYQAIPIEEFGLAYLRGAGWKEGTAIGKNRNGLLEPITYESRPDRLGLGAKVAPEMKKSGDKSKNGSKSSSTSKSLQKPSASPSLRNYSPATPSHRGAESGSDTGSSKKRDRGASLKVGTVAVIRDKRYLGEKAEVLEVQKRDDGDLVKMRLVSNGKVVKVWREDIGDEAVGNGKASKSSNGKTVVGRHWVQPHLRVKIVDRAVRSGSVYKEKCVIQDVFPGGKFIARTDSGRIVDGLYQDQVQTCIPDSNGHVVILHDKSGKPVSADEDGPDEIRAGMTGVVQRKNADKEEVAVQMDHDWQVYTFHFNDVCEVVGSR
ncbi:DExH-box splicing factor binding site-domain-containing protein [Cladochytrium replicatum]|nr:DExH-box splicing factor binding site-domain-containing protein [Cladochytrium replicatum]